MIKPEQIPDEAAESDYITQQDWHKPLRATPTATTNALPGTGHCHRDELDEILDEKNALIDRLTAENEKLRVALEEIIQDSFSVYAIQVARAAMEEK